MVDPLGAVPLTIGRIATRRSSGGVRQFAAILYSIGYEERSTFVAREYSDHASSLVGFTFEMQRVGAFDDNLTWAHSVQSIVVDEPDLAYRKAVVDQVQSLDNQWRQAELVRNGPTETPEALRLAVDVSSMTRQRIADTLAALYIDLQLNVDVDWLYAPATFPGATPTNGIVRVNDPIGGFEGWGDPDLPLACILGAGLEGDLAMGVLDELEPSDTWMMSPRGYSKEHDHLIGKRNVRIEGTLDEGHLIHYRVDQPLETLLTLDSLVDDLSSRSRVVLIPLGPKLFALQCLLIAMSDRRNVTVWRVSADLERETPQRVPSGDIFGLRVASALSHTVHL